MAKLVNAAGTSIKENAALNKNFYDRWHLNIGFSRIEFHTKNKFSVKHKLMPVALGYIVDGFFRSKFEFSKSLRIGEFVFSTNSFRNNEFIDPLAAANPGYIVFKKEFLDDFNVNVHEVVHLHQSNEFSIFNTYLNAPLSRWSSTNKTINWIDRHLYIEFHYLIYRPLYIFERETSINSYYDNFFEHEAEYYARVF
jgi:hypothetical protein